MKSSPTAKTSAPACGGCGHTEGEVIGEIPFYLPGHDIQTHIWRCTECGTYTRDVDLANPELQRHFEVASYTDLSAEHRIRAIRSGFFEYILGILRSNLGRPLTGSRVLDFGCAYGHFLERLRDLDIPAEGVEVVRALRETVRQRGMTVHAQPPQPGSATFDVIVAIDSLYYTNDPAATLRHLRALLLPEGCLLIRVANRTWLLDLIRHAGLAIGNDRFGDAKYNFSVSGTFSLLRRSGFQVVEVYWSEKGKADPRPVIRLYYKIAAFLSEYMSLKVTPGMIVLARPATQDFE
jgi:SAM-dependent methyltransferase